MGKPCSSLDKEESSRNWQALLSAKVSISIWNLQYRSVLFKINSWLPIAALFVASWLATGAFDVALGSNSGHIMLCWVSKCLSQNKRLFKDFWVSGPSLVCNQLWKYGMRPKYFLETQINTSFSIDSPRKLTSSVSHLKLEMRGIVAHNEVSYGSNLFALHTFTAEYAGECSFALSSNLFDILPGFCYENWGQGPCVLPTHP